MPPPKLPVVIHAFVDARRRHRRLRRVVGLPPRRARMRVGEVLGVVKSVRRALGEVVGVVKSVPRARAPPRGEEVVGAVRSRQIGAAALGEVVVVVKSRRSEEVVIVIKPRRSEGVVVVIKSRRIEEFKSALGRAMNEGIERPVLAVPACEVAPC